MRLLPRIPVLVAVLLLVTASVLGQTTASLGGSVSHQGAPLPGVTITITSPNLQGSRVTFSNVNGDFNFGALPPGQYTAKFEMSGMATVTRVANVAVATSNRITAEMQLDAVAEKITVTATSEAVMETPQIASNVSGDLVEELPIARAVLNAALLAPGVNANTISGSQLQISGGPGFDNLVMVNGVTITENVRSQAMNLFIEDAIQETTVLSGAVSAEWGRFTGGVVNSVTKSGGNQFSGSFRDSLSNPSWSDERPGESITVDTVNEVYEATFGGYMLKDRLWFFLAGRDEETSLDLLTSRSSLPYTQTRDETRYEYKLTGAITANHNLVASYLDYDRTIANTGFSAFYDYASIAEARKDPQSLLAAHYNGILTSNLLLEAHYSERTWDVAVGSGGLTTDPVAGSWGYDLQTGRFFNAPVFCGNCDVETRDNDGLNVKLSYYLTTTNMGTHNIVGGVEDFAEQRHANNYQSSSNFGIYTPSVVRDPVRTTAPLMSPDGFVYPRITPGRTIILWTEIFDLSTTNNNLASQAAFINDRWDVNSKLSFNLGLRYDKNKTEDANGNVSSDDDAFSPRLTAIYDVNGDGRHRFTASYNKYVSKVGEGPGTAAESAGAPASIYYLYQGPSINAAGTPTNELLDSRQAFTAMFDWFNSVGGTDNLDLIIAAQIPGYDYTFDGTLQSPSTDEFTFGYGTQIGTNLYAKVDFIYRDWQDFYDNRITQDSGQLVDPILGLTHDVSIVSNTDKISREYKAAQFQLGWRPNRFNVGINYTYGKLEGNDETETPDSGIVGNYAEAYPELLGYSQRYKEGYLAGDQRHRVRAWVGYDVPTPAWLGAINFSLLQNFDSGLPYSAVGLVDPLTYAADELDDYNYSYSSISPYGYNYYFSDRGQFRMEDITSTDIAINYSHILFKNLEFYATAEMLNAFDEQGIVAVDTTVSTNYDDSSFEVFDPRTETPVEGVHWAKSDTFGEPTGPASYQAARLYRFSLGIRF